jgi:hypothetical protein
MSGRLALTKTERVIVDATLQALRSRGLRGWLRRGGKHLAVCFVVPGHGEHKVAVASSPRSLEDAADSQRHEVSRLLNRLLGAPQRGRRSWQERRAVLRAKTEPRRWNLGPPARPGIGPSRDPWAPLAALLQPEDAAA